MDLSGTFDGTRTRQCRSSRYRNSRMLVVDLIGNGTQWSCGCDPNTNDGRCWDGGCYRCSKCRFCHPFTVVFYVYLIVLNKRVTFWVIGNFIRCSGLIIHRRSIFSSHWHTWFEWIFFTSDSGSWDLISSFTAWFSRSRSAVKCPGHTWIQNFGSWFVRSCGKCTIFLFDFVCR